MADDNLVTIDETPEVDNSQSNQEQDTEKEALTKERYKQQLEGSKAEAARLRSMLLDEEVAKASQDANKLLELHKKDPKLADEVAKKFQYSSFEDAKRMISGSDDGLKKSETQEDFDTQYARKRKQEIHEESLVEAEKALNRLPDELQEKAKEFFDKISEGRSLDRQTAIEFAEAATLYVSKDKLKAGKYEEAVSNLNSAGLSGKSKKSTKSSEPQYELNDRGQLVLISNN